MARAAFWGKAKDVAVAVLWIALFAGVGMAATMLLASGTRLVAGNGGAGALGDWAMAASAGLIVAGLWLATWLVGHRLNGRTWTALGWGQPKRLAARLAAGVAMGGGMAAATIGLAVLAGGATLSSDADTGVAAGAMPLAVGLLASALFEELAFRGYPLRRLADAVGPRLATAVLGIGFAAAHLDNPNVTTLGAVNIGIAAVWLAAAFFTTGGMPLAWGLHFGWNAGLGLGFEAPVSGFAFDLPWLDYAPGRRAWIDGGAFGPEGGVVATVVFTAGVVVLLAARRRRRELAAA